MTQMINVSDVIRAVELHRTELLPGRAGSTKLPHEHLAKATGRSLDECRRACEDALDVGILIPGSIERERYRLSEKGVGMHEQMVKAEKRDG